MKRAFVGVMALAASGAVATAQPEGYWVFELSNPVLSPSNPSTTVTLLAGFPTSDYAFAGARLSAHADEAGWSDVRLLDMEDPSSTPLPGPFPDPQGRTPGEISGGDVTGIVHGQLHIGWPANPRNPMPLWQATFTVSDFTARVISLSTTTSDFFVYPHASSPSSQRRAVEEGGGLIHVIPAPASLALLGLGGLGSARRRR